MKSVFVSMLKSLLGSVKTPVTCLLNRHLCIVDDLSNQRVTSVWLWQPASLCVVGPTYLSSVEVASHWSASLENSFLVQDLEAVSCA